MSNIDPFTQKLLLRTQARKEARLKRQVSDDSTPPVESFTGTSLIETKVDSPSKKAPLLEKNEVEKNEHESSPGRSNKRLSSEKLNSSPEKRSKSNKVFQSPNIDENIDPSSKIISPIQRVTIKASIQESPKHTVKPSLASRLNRLNQQYTEQFQIDIEEEKRKQEAAVAQEERRKEHLKEQEKERARIIHERIFGKNSAQQSEEEKINQLRKKYLGDAPKNPTPTAISKFQKTEESMPITSTSDSSGRSTLERHSEITSPDDVQDVICDNERVDPSVKVVDVSMTRKSGMVLNNQDERVSVRDKKSIFEEKMKQEREASTKERETVEWLKKRHCKSSNVVENRDLDKPKETLSNGHNQTSNGKSKPDLGTVKEKCNGHVATESNCNVIVSEDAENDMILEEGNKELKIISTCQDMKTAPVGDPKPIPEPSHVTEAFPVSPFPKSYSDNSIASPMKNYSGDIHSPQPVDYTEDTIYSESRAFDLSSILAIAAHREEAQAHLKTEKVHANRCSTMKVEPFQLIEALPELNMTPIKNESEDEEVLSEFAKAIKNKGKSIKGPDLKQKLAAIDTKLNVKVEIVEKTPKVDENDKIKHSSKSHKKRPEKPPRSLKKIDKVESKESLVDKHQSDTPTGKAGLRTIKEKHHSTGSDEDATKAYVKPIENVTRKKMRKSSSFSEGLGSTPVKSGYHRELSERYNARSSDIPDIVFSKNQQIQSLLEEAASQQNIVLQASQALNVAECSNEDKSNSPEVIEGERLLLLATERRTVCLEEVKSLKESDFNPCQYKENDTIPPCKATLGLTDIKLPLHPEFVLSLKTRKLDIGMFHFVVIVSAGNKNVYSTKVVSCYDDMEDYALVINNSIVMKNIPHDFTLTLKVFGMHSGRMNDQISKLRKNSTNNQSPGNLKNLFSKKNKEDDYSYHASPQTVFRTSNFKLVGETKLNLSLLGNGLTKYALTKVPSKCPLEGCIQMRANCKPEFSANVTGFLTILEDVGGYTAWNRRWCVMKDSRILYWRYPDDEKDQEPMGSIDLRYCSDKVVKVLSRDICARPHTFELTIRRGLLPTDTENLITTIDGKVTKIKYWVCCDDKEDRITWMDAVNKQLSDSKAWRLKKISVKSPVSHQV